MYRYCYYQQHTCKSATGPAPWYTGTRTDIVIINNTPVSLLLALLPDTHRYTYRYCYYQQHTCKSATGRPHCSNRSSMYSIQHCHYKPHSCPSCSAFWLKLSHFSILNKTLSFICREMFTCSTSNYKLLCLQFHHASTVEFHSIHQRVLSNQKNRLKTFRLVLPVPRSQRTNHSHWSRRFTFHNPATVPVTSQPLASQIHGPQSSDCAHYAAATGVTDSRSTIQRLYTLQIYIHCEPHKSSNCFVSSHNSGVSWACLMILYLWKQG